MTFKSSRFDSLIDVMTVRLGFAASMLACLIYVSSLKVQAAASVQFETRDHVSIAATLYKAQGSTQQKSSASRSLIIIAPGFASTKDSPSLSKLCPLLAVHTDVLCFDFRGTGNSGGEYSFGDVDYLDFDPILSWARQDYTQIRIIGFSMGAYSAVRAAAAWPEKIAHLLLISCPTSLTDILLSGGVFTNLTHIFVDPQSPENQTGANIFFRWGNPFSSGPNLVDVDQDLKIPTSFLVGDQDPLVYEKLSRAVYDSMTASKTWNVLPGGEHADAMFLQQPNTFVHWLNEHLSL